jgi:hypothetical protein
MRSLSFSSLVCWLARIFYLFFLLEKGTKRAKRLAFFLSATKKEKKKKIRTSRRSREIFLSFRQEVRRKGRAFLPFLPPARDVLRLAPEKEEKNRARAIKTALTRLARHSRLQTKQKTGPIESLRFRSRKIKVKRALLIVPLKRRRRGKTDGHDRVVSSQTRSAKSYRR